MKPRTLEEVAAAVGGVLEGSPDLSARGASVDSRNVSAGDLFFALPGDRADGHAFVADALRRGAVAAVVGATAGVTIDPGASLIRVPSPGRALLDLASHERGALAIPVVGITGSSGKTCTKDLTAAVLATRFSVTWSPASFNNEIGLPLTLLATGPDTQAVVCEMGARGRGHIRLLCEVARPTIGVVTNVGVAHMELFGSSDAIRDAKAELPESLTEDGVAVLNADDPVVLAMASSTRARLLTFGTVPEADVRGERVSLDPRTGYGSFRLVTPTGAADVTLAVPGEHMVSNALAAAGVGVAFGLTPAEIATGRAGATVSAARMEVFETRLGLRVINDAYNANPASMAAALKALRVMAGDGQAVAVLGGMAELGSIAAEEHERIGELVVRLGIDVLIAVGPEAHRIAAGAEREGLEPARVRRCADAAAAVHAVRYLTGPGDLILVKASRAEGLDRVADALRDGLPIAGTEPTFADATRAGS